MEAQNKIRTEDQTACCAGAVPLHIQSKKGDDSVTVYTVCAGIQVRYHDVHCAQCDCHVPMNQQLISIDYCREGRLEYQYRDGGFHYLGPNDVKVSTMPELVERYAFPTRHFHGISVCISLSEACESLDSCFSFFGLDVKALREWLCDPNGIRIIRTGPSIRRVFEDLYDLRENARTDSLRLKIVELLMQLVQIEQLEIPEKRAYFQRHQVEKVRQMKAYLCSHTDLRITLPQLAEEYDLPLKTLKACFKNQYGQSVYAFIKEFRLQKAAQLLQTTDHSILEISQEVGYESPSKFAAAFKNRFHLTPLKYRKTEN